MAFSGLLTRRRVVAFAVESVQGTAETLGTADADFNISNVSWRPIVTSTQSDNLSDTFTKSSPRAAGVAQGEITFTTELVGLKSLDGTAFGSAFDQSTEAFPALKMLSCCGMQQTPDVHYALVTGATMSSGTMLLDGETVDETTGAGITGDTMIKCGHHFEGMPRVWLDDGDDAGTYDYTNIAGLVAGANGEVGLSTSVSNSRIGIQTRTDPDSINTATIGVYHDGKRFTIKGARGTFTMEGTFGNTVKLNFTFLGVLDTTQTGDATLISKTLDLYKAPTYTNVDLMTAAEGVATDFVLTHANFTYDHGATLSLREDASSEDGYGCTAITDRNSTLRISPDATTVASGVDWTSAFTAGTPYGFFMEINKGVTPVQEGNNFDIQFNGAVLTEETPGDRDGVETEDLTFALTAGSLPDGSQGSDTELFIFNF